MVKFGPVLLCAVLLVGAAALVLATRSTDSPGEATGVSEAPVRQCVAKSDGQRPVYLARSKSSKSDREVRALTARQVRDALPEAVNPLVFVEYPAEDAERVQLLFRRLGALEGEAALDEILSRYGKGRYTGQAMALAIAGWMEVDPAAALSAFRELLGSEQPREFGLRWKGAHVMDCVG